MYNVFSKYYDDLMGDVDYKARTEYLYSLFCKFGKTPKLLLDLACGTGGFSNEFAKKGISVIGVDKSNEMLCIAKEKSLSENLDVLYICQSAENLELYETVDGAICCLDSLNHITDYNVFCEAFVKVSEFLNKGSLFIFDMNTVFKHEKVLGDNTFVVDSDNVYCVWQNFYSVKNKTTDIILDFFELEDGKYIRSSESFSERAYDDSEIKSALKNAGLTLLAVFGDMKDSAPKYDEQRKIFVARKE